MYTILSLGVADARKEEREHSPPPFSSFFCSLIWCVYITVRRGFGLQRLITSFSLPAFLLSSFLSLRRLLR